MKPPFPHFGGKARVAEAVWQRFGDTRNYIEPFFGGGAVLLKRPHWSVPEGAWFDGRNRTETVNDINGFISNFWRAIQHAPEEVAAYADYPVIEQDLHARHAWLMGHRFNLSAHLIEDPDFFDAQIAGWWVWGICAWIGAGWCDEKSLLKGEDKLRRKLPRIGDGDGRGVQGVVALWRQRPQLSCEQGIHVVRQIPHISHPTGQKVHAVLRHKRPEVGRRGGKGVHQASLTQGKRPELAKDGGINQLGLKKQLPHLDPGGRGGHRAHREALTEWFTVLSQRLRRVRVTCGDWKRITGESVTTRIGVTAAFLDPPYSHEERDGTLYAFDSAGVAAEVREWAIENGDNPKLRIAVCGYEGEHEFPDSWECFAWKAGGGYGNRSGKRGAENRHKERIWFSPHCEKVAPPPPPEDTPFTLPLFDMEAR